MRVCVCVCVVLIWLGLLCVMWVASKCAKKTKQFKSNNKDERDNKNNRQIFCYTCIKPLTLHYTKWQTNKTNKQNLNANKYKIGKINNKPYTQTQTHRQSESIQNH